MSDTEPFEAVIESSDASAKGASALFEQTAAFMHGREGRYTLRIEINEK